MELSRTMQKGIQETLNCYRVCSETMAKCIEMGGEHAEPFHLQIMMDCANICAVTAEFMMRGSTYYEELCDLCADICEDCAESCETFDDKFMKECGRECNACAAHCRDMVEE